MQALKAVPGLINRAAGSGAEALTGIAEKDLRKLGPFGEFGVREEVAFCGGEPAAGRL